MALPDTIPTVTVTGRYLAPDGTPLAGQVVWRAPAMLTFSASDVVLGGPVTAPLDATGRFEVVLPATDAPGMSPGGWSYIVAEQLTGVPANRSYNVLLPSETPVVDIADLAPTDPTTPNFVPVVGSQILTGSAGPTAAQGVNTDWYVQYDTRTLLGLTHTTVTNWRKTNGTWAKVGADIHGSQIFLNNASTPSSDAKPGDILIRTDSGDMWQRGASGWGSSVGNLKGPKGDTGPQGVQGIQGVQGPKGDPGNGNVNTVNTKLGPDIVLSAADVGALSATGTNANVVTVFRGNGTNAPLNVYGNGTDPNRFTVLKDGSWYSNALANTAYNMAIGDMASDFGGGTYVLALKNASVVPTANPANGVVAYAEGGVMKVRQANGTVVTVGSGGGGAVASVNGATGAVVLNAASVGALKDPAGDVTDTTGTLRIKYAGAAADAFKASNAADALYTAINKDGQIVTNTLANLNGRAVVKADASATDPLRILSDTDAELVSFRKSGSVRFTAGNGYVDKNLRVGGAAGAVGIGAGVTGVLAIDAGTGPSAANTGGVNLWTAGGSLMVQETSGRTFAVGSNGRNAWTPQALGFQAWSVDPASVANPTTLKAVVVGRIYFSGMNITESTQVNHVVIHARGWAGSTAVPAARFYVGIYNEAGTRVATSALVSNLPAAGQGTGMAPAAVNSHIGPVPVPLSAAVTLAPGRYWAAFLMSAGAATDFYYFHVQNEAPANPGNFSLGTHFQRHWCIPSGQTSLPATVNQSTGEVGLDPAIMALAML
ncbi:hypothetical protein ACFW6F_16655 [Streptomyces sp. NPDC058746]|uniref:hypothetical protein n=1 Tax=Streptomyces sp. NPDC058746 TaxID=3346622 RepID=UPI00368A2A57